MTALASTQRYAAMDPRIPKTGEIAFQQWYAGIAKQTGVDPNPDDPRHFYDYRSAHKAGAKPDASGHMPSQFKREGHPNLVVDGVDTRTGRSIAAPRLSRTDLYRSLTPGSSRSVEDVEAAAQWAALNAPRARPQTSSPIADEWARGRLLAEQARLMAAAVVTPNDLPGMADSIVDLRRRMATIPINPAMQRMQGMGFWSSIGHAISNPLDVAAPLAAGSFSTFLEAQLPVAVAGGLAGAGVGSVIPGAGTTVGGVVGFAAGTGAGSLVVEAASEYFDLIESNISASGGDLNDPAAWRQALADPKIAGQARTMALQKGIPIAVFDALSAAVGGKIITTAGRGIVGKAAAGAAEIGVQGGLGGIGEAAGQLVQRGEIVDPSAIAAEIIGEIGPGAVEVAAGATIRKGAGQSQATEPTDSAAKVPTVTPVEPGQAAPEAMDAIGPVSPTEAAEAEQTAAVAEVDRGEALTELQAIKAAGVNPDTGEPLDEATIKRVDDLIASYEVDVPRGTSIPTTPLQEQTDAESRIGPEGQALPVHVEGQEGGEAVRQADRPQDEAVAPTLGISSREEPPEPGAAAVGAPPAPGVSRQPWEMTQSEALTDPAFRKFRPQNAGAKEAHRREVRSAIEEGKPVPAAVLADYPDLQPTAPAPQAAAETQAAGGVTREVVAQQLEQAAPQIPPEQRTAALALMDARAAAWSRQTGRPAQEWFTERLGGIQTDDADADALAVLRQEDAKPAVTIAVPDDALGGAKSITDLRRAARAFYRKSLQGRTVTVKATGDAIVFSSEGGKKSVAGQRQPREMMTTAVLDQLVESSVLARTEPDRRGDPNLTWHYYRADADIAGERLPLTIVVKEVLDPKTGTRRKFYDRYVTAQKEPAGTSGGSAPGESLPLPATAGSSPETIAPAEGEVKGLVQFQEDGRAIIRAFAAADISTIIHELGHIFRRELTPEDATVAAEWAGAQGGKWDRPAEEKFARGFERYLRDGTAPNAQLRDLFDRFRQWLVDIYRSLRGSPLAVKISPEIRGVFDRLLAEEDVAYSGPSTSSLLPPEIAQRLTEQVNASTGVEFAQAADAQSEAFHKWFGESKVVDESGAPLVVYHGTEREFTTFDRTKIGSFVGGPTGAFWFTDTDEAAQFYSSGVRPSLQVYLRITDPLVVSSDDFKSERIGTGAWALRAMDGGHDGLILRDIVDGDTRSTVYAVFDPEQIKSATGNRGTFDPSDPNILHQEASRPRTVKQQIREAVFGPPKAVSEQAALAGSLKGQQRAARQAWRESRNVMRDKIVTLREKWRQRWDAKRKEIEARGAAAKQQAIERMRGRQEIITGLQTDLRRAVETTVPKRFQGRFLKAVQTITTPAASRKALAKMLRTIAESRHDDAARDLRKAMRAGKKAAKKVETDRKRLIRDAMREGKALLAGNPKSAQQYIDAADSMAEVAGKIREPITEFRAERKAFAAGQVATITQHRARVVADVEVAKSKMKIVPKREEDLDVGVTKRFLRGQLDVDNLTRKIEGRWNGTGTLHELYADLKVGEEGYNSDTRDTQQWLDERTRAAGLGDLGTALATTAGTLGDPMAQRVDVTLGGKTVSILMGEAVGIAAQDDNSLAKIAAGRPIQFNRGRQQTPIKATVDEIEAIRASLPPEVRKLVGEMKWFMENRVRPKLFDVHLRLKGWMPEKVANYWPTTVNRKTGAASGLAEGWRGAMQTYLENAGFLKDRKEDKSAALVIKDFLSTFLDHTDHAHRVIHMAERVRNVDAVINAPEVITTIAQRWGTSANRMLQEHLQVGSLAERMSMSGSETWLQRINNNFAMAMLSLNIQTYLKQFGGLASLAAHMDAADFAAGIGRFTKNPASVLRRLKRESGFLWDRYSDTFARFTPVGGSNLNTINSSGLNLSAKAALMALKAHDLKAGYSALHRAARSMHLLDFFDSIVPAVAWAGYDAKARKEHPAWTAAERTKWVAQQVATAVRSTQNASSPLDQTTFATHNRNSVVRFFLMFTSQPLKQYNQLVRQMHQGWRPGLKAALGVAANVAWSAGVAGGMTYALATLGAAFSGDDDEYREMQRRAKAWDRIAFSMVRDVAGLIYTGDWLVEAVAAARDPWRSDRIATAPLQDVVKGGFGSVGQMISGAVDAMGDDEERADKASQRVLAGLEDLIDVGMQGTGFPLLPFYYHYLTIQGEMNRIEQDDRSRRRSAAAQN